MYMYMYILYPISISISISICRCRWRCICKCKSPVLATLVGEIAKMTLGSRSCRFPVKGLCGFVTIASVSPLVTIREGSQQILFGRASLRGGGESNLALLTYTILRIALLLARIPFETKCEEAINQCSRSTHFYPSADPLHENGPTRQWRDRLSSCNHARGRHVNCVYDLHFLRQ